MPNPFQLEITLKQHTPIIHFQHDQAGATLRATEVKPKLDKFLLTKLGEPPASLEEAKSRKWLSGDGSHHALDYKMHINTTRQPLEMQKPFAPYFGNMGQTTDKLLSYAPGNIICKIFSAKPGLTAFIKENIVAFFALNNTGTRQSKGFGSFSVEEINKEKISADFNSYYKYSFEIRTDKGNWYSNCQNLFRQLDWFYRSIRSGINLNGKLYFKSSLFMYLYNQNPSIQWDKKTIKAHYLNQNDITIQELNKKTQRKESVVINYLASQNAHHNQPDILALPQRQTNDLSLKNYRDLLGLSSEESWRSYRANISKKHSNNNVEEVVRYKSPILFKPVQTESGFSVYFDVFFDGSEKKYHGEPFKISISHRAQELRDRNSADLELPIADNFNFHHYFRYAFQNINPANHIQHFRGEDGNEIRESLISIYKQLRTQLINE